MPKGILKYSLPEERDEFETAQKGIHYLIVIEDMDNYLRGKLKYSELTEEQANIYQEIRDKLSELKNDQ